MGRKLTHEEFVNDLAVINPNIEVIGKYKGKNKLIKVKCKNENCCRIWNPRSRNLLDGQGCICKRLKTHEEFVNDLAVINPNIEVIGEYRGVNIPIEVKCKIDGCGNKWESPPHNLLIGRKCKCKRLKTQEEFVEQMRLLNPNIEVIGKYNGVKNPIMIKHKKCGHIYNNRTPNNILKPRMVSCSKCRGLYKTQEEFVEQMRLINPNIEVIGEYKGSNIPIEIRCKMDGCGYKWNPKATKLLCGNGCPKCRGLYKTQEEFVEQMRLINPNIEVIGEYKGSNIPIECECEVCGLKWNPKAGKLLIDRGCPKCNVGFTKSVCLYIINTLSETDLLTMDPVELFIVIGQGKLPSSFSVLTNTQSNSTERIISLKELKKTIESSKDDSEDDHHEVSSVTTTVEDKEIEDSIDEETIETKPEKKLPIITSKAINDLKTIDNQIYHGMDSEAIAVLMEYKLRKLWNNVINDDSLITPITNTTGGEYFTIIKNKFLYEYNKVINISIDDEYSFGYLPNLMQKLTVYRLMTKRSYGNFSGTGSGKTLSFILSSRLLKTKLTLVVVLNSTVQQTCDYIKSVYPNSNIYTKYEKDYQFSKDEYNYLVLNYEKFQQEYSEELFQSLTNNNVIDFVVLDEIQSVKQRDAEQESKRREILNRLLGRIRESNKDVYILAMSATPIINNLQEGKSLLSMITGLEYNDLQTRRTISNALKLFMQLTINGLRFIPKYDISVSELTGQNMSNLDIDGSHLTDDIIKLSSYDYLGVEKLILGEKLNNIHPYLRKGTIIYSHYVEDMIIPITKHIEKLGFKVRTYTGNESIEMRNINLNMFMSGKIDILIGSRPIGTGVDGLQGICNRIIILSLPWTDAEYAQLKGRIYRQGSIFKDVEIIIPQVKIDIENSVWSWDIQRLNLIKNKGTLADVALDGVFHSNKIPSPETMFKRSQTGLIEWKNRLEEGIFIHNERDAINIDLYPEISNDVEREKRINTELQEFNRRGKTLHSSNMHKKFVEKPDSWYRYHSLRKSRMEHWEEIPYEYIATKITNPNDIVVDFGCGENLFKKCVSNNKVYSFDHIAIDETVTACDMKDTKLESNSIDICVFSLSLWGSNYVDYLKESYRILKNKGEVYIAEASSSYDSQEKQIEFTDILNDIGFKLIGSFENRGKFTYINAIKKF